MKKTTIDMMMKTKYKTTEKVLQKEKFQKEKKVSKTWTAFLKNAGSGSILDIEAVLK